MKKLLSLLTKLLLTSSVLIVIYFALNNSNKINNLEYNSSKISSSIPSELRWYDLFKGIENLPSKEQNTNNYKVLFNK